MSEERTTITVSKKVSKVIGKVQELEDLSSKSDAIEKIIKESKYHTSTIGEVIEGEFGDLMQRIPNQTRDENKEELLKLEAIVKQVLSGSIESQDYNRIFNKKEYNQQIKDNGEDVGDVEDKNETLTPKERDKLEATKEAR